MQGPFVLCVKHFELGFCMDTIVKHFVIEVSHHGSYQKQRKGMLRRIATIQIQGRTDEILLIIL